MPPLRRSFRSIALWLRTTEITLAALVCGLPGLLPAAAPCGPERIPQNSIGSAFQRGCDERAAGHYVDAARSFNEAARRAHELHDLHWEAKSRAYVGTSQLFNFQYGAALETIEAAVALAKRGEDYEVAGSSENNISSIYAQLGDFEISRQKLVEAIHDLQRTDHVDMLAMAYFALSYQEIRFGAIDNGIQYSKQAIEAAQKAKRPDLVAAAWDIRGAALLLTHHLDEADRSMQKAVDLYQRDGKDIPSVTLEHVAELKWKQKQNEAALGYIQRAFANADSSFKTSPQYYPLSVQAEILRDLGRTDEALDAYRKAINSANRWRLFTLPGDTTNIQTVRELNNTYQSFAEFAAGLSLQRRSEALAREALQALAGNRAASLREQLALEMGRNQTLPPEYLAKLGELQSVQARVTLSGDATSQATLTELENEIAELETKMGLRAQKKSLSLENNQARNSLRDIQSGLRPTEALLSFCLGERQSFLWAVTREAMNLYRLPAAGEIGEVAQALRDGIERRRNFASAARNLSNDLFSQLDAKFWRKPDWLIVGDGALLDRVPFAALPTRFGEIGELVKEHTIRLLPSELLMLARTTDAAESRFVGIADPVYNLADSRRPQQTVWLNTASSRESSALGRLPGSQREVRSSAKYSGMARSDLLIGTDANLAALTAALSQHPSIIHFAVHVVSPPGHPEQAALALSLGKDNIPELLTREKIASLRVPDSLVVLSGCSSGQGETAPSAGLIGLSRAWLLAGASAVVVSNWPTPDDSGRFFAIFYSQLSSSLSGAHGDSLAKRVAGALQQAQLQIQRYGGYGSAPAFWAAYSIISKE